MTARVQAFFTLLSWLIRLRWLRGKTRYMLGAPWAGYIYPVVYSLGWKHGSGSVSWWRFWQAHRYVQAHAGIVTDPDGTTEVWRTPAEFYARGGGVCRDWATAILDKAVQLGINPDVLGWLYLRKRGNDDGHIMAAMLVDGDFWLTDQNRTISERASRILAQEFGDYEVVAWFNDVQVNLVTIN